jgi:putative ABC transport system permease protein
LFASILGAPGLTLASVGIFGAVSYAVARRTREAGIRMALGATKRDVVRMILADNMRPVLVGLLFGFIGASVAAYLLRAILFGVSALDPVSFLGVSAFFLAVAMLAAYVPARGATRVDPMVALRYEWKGQTLSHSSTIGTVKSHWISGLSMLTARQYEGIGRLTIAVNEIDKVVKT